jgi:hypothetical protein
MKDPTMEMSGDVLLKRYSALTQLLAHWAHRSLYDCVYTNCADFEYHDELNTLEQELLRRLRLGACMYKSYEDQTLDGTV